MLTTVDGSGDVLKQHSRVGRVIEVLGRGKDGAALVQRPLVARADSAGPMVNSRPTRV
jgi:hypothetical protein